MDVEELWGQMEGLWGQGKHFGDSHSFDPDLTEGVLYLLEFERFDDGFDFLHRRFYQGLVLELKRRSTRSPEPTREVASPEELRPAILMCFNLCIDCGNPSISNVLARTPTVSLPSA